MIIVPTGLSACLGVRSLARIGMPGLVDAGKPASLLFGSLEALDPTALSSEAFYLPQGPEYCIIEEV